MKGIQTSKPCRPTRGFPSGSAAKNLLANGGDVGETGSVPGLGRSLGEGNGNLLQYSCLRNPMDRGAWQVIVCGGHKEWDRTEHII